MQSLIHGPKGHPLHPPLTDAAIGAYTVAVVFAVVGSVGWIEDAAGKTTWLALLVGIGAGVASAATGLADLMTISRSSAMFRTAALHGSLMGVASLLFVLAAVFQYDGFHDGSVTTSGLVLAIAAYLILVVGASIGGTLVFKHAMRVETDSAESDPVAVVRADHEPSAVS
jgi:uncharacterized membrane protein